MARLFTVFAAVIRVMLAGSKRGSRQYKLTMTVKRRPSKRERRPLTRRTLRLFQEDGIFIMTTEITTTVVEKKFQSELVTSKKWA